MDETGGGEGIEVLKNEPFTKDHLPPPDPLKANGQEFFEGQYTHKIYHLESKVPSIIRLLAPKGSLAIHEEAWNAYPYCRTVITNPDYMKDSFHIVIESMHIGDRGQLPNAHDLSSKEVESRDVCFIDIANDPCSSKDYKKDRDPSIFKSTKTGRGPLKGDSWMNTTEPVMCAYKLVRAKFKWFPMQTKVERFIMKQEQRIFTNFHREVFCWLDEWHGLTMKDIRQIEDDTKKQLDEERKKGEVRGTSGDD